jgi:hypothetical protein
VRRSNVSACEQRLVDSARQKGTRSTCLLHVATTGAGQAPVSPAVVVACFREEHGVARLNSRRAGPGKVSLCLRSPPACSLSGFSHGADPRQISVWVARWHAMKNAGLSIQICWQRPFLRRDSNVGSTDHWLVRRFALNPSRQHFPSCMACLSRERVRTVLQLFSSRPTLQIVRCA